MLLLLLNTGDSVDSVDCGERRKIAFLNNGDDFDSDAFDFVVGACEEGEEKGDGKEL